MAKKRRPSSSRNPGQNAGGQTPPRRAPRRERRTSSVQNRKEERLKLQQKQKRQWLYTRIGIGVIVLALIGWAAWGGWQAYRGYQVRDDTIEYFGKDSFVATHDAGEILYEQIPPVGGYHNTVLQNCAFYDSYVVNQHAVHSLEHGAVWITYDPDLPQDEKDQLRDISDQSYVLVSPYPGMGNPVTLSIWGHQLKLNSFDMGKIDDFIREFKAKQEYTPEFGAVCYGGTSATTDVMPQQDPYVRADPNGEPVGGIPVAAATATAEALNPVPTQLPSTPVASPVASPEASPVASPVAVKRDD